MSAPEGKQGHEVLQRLLLGPSVGTRRLEQSAKNECTKRSKEDGRKGDGRIERERMRAPFTDIAHDVFEALN